MKLLLESWKSFLNEQEVETITPEQNKALKELYVIISKTYEHIKNWAEQKGYDTSSGSFKIKVGKEYQPPFNLKKQNWNILLDVSKYKSIFPNLADDFYITFKPDVDGNAELAIMNNTVQYIAINSSNFNDVIAIKRAIQHELQHIIDFGTIKADGIEGTINYLANIGEVKAHAKEAAYYFHKTFPKETNFDIEKVKTYNNKYTNYYNFLTNPEDIVKRKELDPKYVNIMKTAGEKFIKFASYYLSLFKKQEQNK